MCCSFKEVENLKDNQLFKVEKLNENYLYIVMK